jgi:hypothetical protein
MIILMVGCFLVPKTAVAMVAMLLLCWRQCWWTVCTWTGLHAVSCWRQCWCTGCTGLHARWSGSEGKIVSVSVEWVKVPEPKMLPGGFFLLNRSQNLTRDWFVYEFCCNRILSQWYTLDTNQPIRCPYL